MKLPKPIVYILGGIAVLIVIVTVLILIASFFKIPDWVSNSQKTSPTTLSTNQEPGFNGNASRLINVSARTAIISYPVEISSFS